MERNGTVMLSLGGYVEIEKYRYVYFLFLLPLFVVILCSNGIIIFLIWIHRKLHEPMYIFIAALSLNSILLTTPIYPKILVDVLSHKQIISYSGCLTQAFFYYSVSASDFLLLLAMAYDRYVSICRPMQYSSIMGTTTVTIFLALAWFLPAFQMSVSLVLQSKQKICNTTLEGFYCNVKMLKIHCSTPIYLTVWALFNLTCITFLPMLLILITYIKIFITIHNSHGEIRKKALDTCLPHVTVLIITFSLLSIDIIIAFLGAVLPKRVSLIFNLQVLVYNPLCNPIMYGLKMKEIWKRIKRMLLRE
ncbi:olfactory receptor 10J4-like [Corythoichthys intestinalis]|uniref:olfactory receptor 10J4-like n=1 Tax=Corythoichthys intestinalis TaxID=161448 RepID=UPI0025A4F377|nr:olfactory receptor 10J4-like [Corythoichthys intestinalis]XP_061809809.1 olfactory receptor 10J4-like [Nerophis lumbriciformis]